MLISVLQTVCCYFTHAKAGTRTNATTPSGSDEAGRSLERVSLLRCASAGRRNQTNPWAFLAGRWM